MKREDLQELEARAMKEVVKCRGLGEYSTEAGGIWIAFEILLRVLQHLVEMSPAPKQRGKKNVVSDPD